MRSDVGASGRTKRLKRALEHTDSHYPERASKQRRLHTDAPLPTPSPCASPTCDQPSRSQNSRQQSSTYSSHSEPARPLERAREEPEPDCAPNSKLRRISSSVPSGTPSVDDWLLKLRPNRALSSAADSGILATIEAPARQPASEQMSQQDGENPRPSSVVSGQSERLNASHRLFRSTLKMNHIAMDVSGRKMAPEVKDFVDTYIRKRRTSPGLGDDDKARVVDKVEKMWDKAEPMVSDITTTAAFPVERAGIAEGRDTLWSDKSLPRNPEYSYALPAPKPDRHYGYPMGQDSDWTAAEIAVIDHRMARPYLQPSSENVLPFFMVDLKSEASGGNLYGAESQAAVAGAHSVHSMRWLLLQANPSRVLKSTDAVALTAAVTQREAVVHVVWYSPERELTTMSFVDAFTFVKDSEGCCRTVKSIIDWGLQVRQPIVRENLKLIHPMLKNWKKGRSASSIADGTGSFANDGTRSSKSQRTEVSS